MSETPLVSCICPTYGRFPDSGWLVGEAVESFLRQDYSGPKELILINDAPAQFLFSDSPGVRVVNLPARVSSLGEKYNLAIALARGDYILTWEDDDISLPHRISSLVQAVIERDVEYLNPKGYFFLTYSHGEPHQLSVNHPIGVSHNASIYSRRAWQAVGGYPAISGAQDMQMDQRLRRSVRSSIAPRPVSEWSYIYRWGVQSQHLSGRAPHDAFYAHVGTLPVAPGRFRIEPHWRHDYSAMAHAALESAR